MKQLSNLLSILAAAAAFMPGALAQTMTFDSLDPDFADYPYYGESGIVLSGDSLMGSHFHAVSNGLGTAALVFATDGVPQFIRYNAPVFDLESIEFTSFDTATSARVIASNGASATIDSVGVHAFDSSFDQIQWARLEFGQAGSTDAAYQFDNIRVAKVASVPDSSEGALGLGLGALVMAQRWIARRTKQGTN